MICQSKIMKSAWILWKEKEKNHRNESAWILVISLTKRCLFSIILLN